MRLPANRIELIRFGATGNRLKELRGDALSWNTALAPIESDKDLSVQVRRGLLLAQVADALYRAAEITPVELIEHRSSTGEVDLVARESEKHTKIMQALKVDSPKGYAVPAVTSFEAVPGFGAQGSVEGHTVAVGADRYMERLGLDVTKFRNTAERLGIQGKSPLYAAIDGRLAAVIAVADPIKPTTPAAIQALHDLGLKVAMITGDNRRTAEAIARTLGIDEVVAEVLPEGKVEAIKRLRHGGRLVAFVGDGINDAPALAEADVGLAIGTGTDVAIESADVVLMSGDLQGVSNAIGLSKATLQNIGQNLFWAFAYNVLLIPVAAGALYPFTGILLSPMLAAGAMALSSVFVLGNAMRLKRFRAPHVPLIASQPRPQLAAAE